MNRGHQSSLARVLIVALHEELAGVVVERALRERDDQ